VNPEPIEIALRAYVPPRGLKKQSYDAAQEERALLVIDTETTEDEYQNLVFGSCGVWVSGYLHKFILFYAPSLQKKGIDTLVKYAISHEMEEKHIEVMPLVEFVEKVFFLWIVKNHALCVGFSLPFDLSRLATRYGYGREKWNDGFTFWLTDDTKLPGIHIRSLDSVRSFFAPAPTKHSGKVNARFLDLRALGFALTNQKLSLKRACEVFNTQRRKIQAERHGRITIPYIDYNVNDTLATYELYTKMIERLQEFKLDIPPEKSFSPASLGKAYLRKIGIRPFSEKNPDFPPEILGYLMTTYYGGRSEVRIRKRPVKVRLMDFKSMYPTLFVLMDLWKYLTADRIEYYDSTDETKSLLSKLDLNLLTNASLYRRLVTIVQILIEDDILPGRAHYGEDKSVYNIGINYLTSRVPLWYTLADVIASKLLTGKVPKILRAVSFRPVGIQRGLQPVQIPGGLTLATGDDLIRALVEYRSEIQRKQDTMAKNTQEHDRLDVVQTQLKILANATSYGIFIEVNTKDQATKVQAYGLKPFAAKVNKTEEFGRYFNPILATMLTSGARLMLAMVEAWLEQHGGYYAFCDTDSMAVSPRHWKPLQAFFQSLSPYDSNEPLLKLEYDDRDENGRLLDLWFYGISAKRYVLYRIINGEPSMVEDGWSSHGLGHLLHRNKEDEDDGIRNRWEGELWTRIIKCANGELSEDELCEKYSGEYAVTKYAVTTPHLHRRLRKINRNRDIRKQIKPFNFVLIGQPEVLSDTGEPIHPITRFTKRTEEAPFQPFIDYNTGERYPGGSQLYWKTLSSMMREYLDHPESKFHNGAQTGKMKRRHLHIQKKDQIHYIGKEADQIEQTEILGVDDESYVEYRKAETRFNVLSNPNGSVAVNRIMNWEKELEDARDGIADMTNDTDEPRRENEDLRERLAKLEQKLA
jgi:hypothetical protein